MRYCAVHIAGPAHSPKCPIPAFRILGLFDSEGSASRFVNTTAKNHNVNVFLVPTHNFCALTPSQTKQLDDDYLKTTINEILMVHEEMIQKSEKSFKQKDLKQGESELVKNSRIRQKHKEKLDQTSNSTGISIGPLQSGSLPMGQTHAAIIYLPDLRTDVDVVNPLIAVLFAGSLKDCESYADSTAKKIYQNCNIDIVDMGQWIYPTLMDEAKLNRKYDEETLTDIIRHKQEEDKKIADMDKQEQEKKKLFKD